MAPIRARRGESNAMTAIAELDGRVAIVTGGANGIGLACARRFLAEGARVVIADIDPDAGVAAVAELGDAALFHQTDVTDPEQVQGAVDLAVSCFGGLHVMVNNAGVASSMARFLQDDLSDFRRVVDINLYGVLVGSQRAALQMKAQGSGGSIINMSSTAGVDAGAGLVTYRATKAAVLHASRSIALDVAQYGIRVNCVMPGQIRTGMTTYDMDRVRQFTQPLPREGCVEDVAEAVLYLAGDRSAQVTGIVLPVDGGTTAGPPASQLRMLLGGESAKG
jgi:NAD(P)-dependent dehydrogenase (short-subunit alcohol dehydrogenase family)